MMNTMRNALRTRLPVTRSLLAVVTLFLIMAPSTTRAQRSRTQRPTPQSRSRSSNQRSSEERLKEITMALNDSFISSSGRHFARCHLNSAVWGGYDIKVTVAQGNDAQLLPVGAYVFAIVKGQFSKRSASLEEQPHFNAMATVTREGKVQIPDQEQAFKVGIPFFIKELSFESPEMVQFTVVSNPTTKVSTAHVALEFTSKEGETNISGVMVENAVIGSKEEPQRLRQKMPFELAQKFYLSLVESNDNHCLLSNEVVVEDARKPTKPKSKPKS